jgi:hypothetical protein
MASGIWATDALAGLVGAVAQRHVRNFVSHHAGQLRFVVSGFDHAAVDIDVPAGKRKRVDPAVVDGLEGVRILVAGGVRRKPLAQVIQVFVHPRVIQQEHLIGDFVGSLLAQLDVLLR